MLVCSFVRLFISIHMPHTWHDCLNFFLYCVTLSISIHMPHTWHDVELMRHASASICYFNPHATYVA